MRLNESVGISSGPRDTHLGGAKPETRASRRMSVRHIAAFALLSLCGLLSTGIASANDLQSGDLLIGAAVPAGFGGLGNGAILLARNGTVSVFCQSPANSADPNYFADPTAVIADSSGRVVFLAEVGLGLTPFAPGTAVLRCDGIGATPVMLGYFPSTSAVAPGYPIPVIPGVLTSGATFISNGPEAATASGLHLIGLHTASLNDLAAGVTTQDAYSLVVGTQAGGAVSIRYRATDQIWEADSQVIGLTTGNIDITTIDAINHSGATYSTNGVNIQKFEDPLTVNVSGTILGTSFTATLNLFGSANSFPSSPTYGFTIEYNTAIPQIPSGCKPPAPPLDNSMPTNTGGLLVPFNGGSIQSVLYDEFTGFGLIATTDYGPAQGPWLASISEALLDNPGDPTQYFQDGNIGCIGVPFVPVTIPLPFTGVNPPPTGYALGAAPSYKPASSAIGPVAVQFSSTLPGGTQVIQMVSGTNAPIVVTGAQLTAAGFAGAHGIGAYPNGVSAGTGLTVFLRVDSPVNILITDPTGKQLGVDSLGNAHNDFSGTIVNSITGGSQNVNNGFDSGPGEPRFFAIRNPIAGTYNVQSIGTGSGPYTVHVYSVNLANPTGQAISVTGTAAVGAAGTESFTLDSSGNVAFTSVSTTTALTISPSTANTGTLVTFTATVTAANSATPTGTVTFYNGATVLGTASVGSDGTATFTSSMLAAGSYSVTAQYGGNTPYTASTSSAQPLTLTVVRTTPVISWTTPAAITYGTALSAAQLDATASVPGTFVYSPPSGTVLTAGSQTLSVTFTPTDTTDYNTATTTMTLTVNKAAPLITWATPAAITYGTALSAAQLDATASVPGTFVYSPPSGTVLTAGSQTLSVTFTPTDTTDYNTATATVTLTVNKAGSLIAWATPAAVTYGTALSAAQLDATANVPGTFVYSPASGTVLLAGSQTLGVTFTPTDTTDYNTATATVTLTVNKAGSLITWATPAAVTYGTALSAAQLNATANVPGTFVYSPASGTVLMAGSQTLGVTFTPTDTTDYNTATATVKLTVNKAAPVITWATPAAITYGTALSAAQLNATANVPGTFVYSPPSGTVLAVGSQTLNVTFTPTDTTDYNTATATVTLQVNQTTSTAGFTITVIPSQERVRLGDVAAFILQLESVHGFSGNVKLSCSGGPAGSECADLPMTVGLNGTAYAVSGILFPRNTTPGTYTITFTGVSGVITSTATATFTVE